jgi:CRISPR/Cas system-associated exonuclease Cas4 (RecB family)
MNVHEWEEKRREACKNFRPLLENVDKWTEDEIYDLLAFDKNQSMGAVRVAPLLISNIAEFKRAVKTLIDESRDVKERLNEALKAPGMGPAIATMILFLYNPEKYPFWSRAKEEILKKLGLIDELTGTYGEKYSKIIEAEKKLSAELGIDLIKLDTFLWWFYKKKIQPTEEMKGEMERAIPFKAESELRDYLSLHPEKIERGLSLVGVEYNTDVGRIDLLCRDKDGNFVVVELKKAREGDKALGQLLRYMGWVKEKMAGSKEVRGILITHEFDENLEYAIKAIKETQVQIKYYAIRFELSDTPFEINS